MAAEWITLALLGGALALDGTSLGQLMVSRPLVSGVLAGWILGDPAGGLLMGGLLELFHLPVIPSGGARFPESGPAAVVGTAIALSAPGAGGVALGVLTALAWGQLGGASIIALRKVNGRLVAEGAERVPPIRVVAVHGLGILLDAARGVVLTGAGLAVGVLGVAPAAAAWPLDMPVTLALLLVGASVPVGALGRALGALHRRWKLLAAGLGAGLAAGAFL